MPDFTIRNVDHLLAERIQAFAKHQQWTVNEVLLHALRRGLGAAELGAQAETQVDAGEFAAQTGAWNAAEQAVFRETALALSVARSDQLAPTAGEMRLFE
ncbi:MAG: hypothetical protein BGP10_00085 [Rhodanobacter sp. 68-29]|uniref:hypothetical protein n=1 Tax=Rhodanobacter sp. PCA2 TaxID=2006117 RepID=UPI00086B93B9|nr:hypothetical protein [Rhodanobacter sp. PCA2]MBA2080014.1 hypothetical protein [Rhodanobacter sp. PCA2]MBN8924881.1 hypothetical protein [Rhodanobacter sp.]ODU73228.1 MAG: hypothetical protein ABT17_12695 [Rhodanobacter sp. SCN 69-32]OJY57469.1 MAG: hypothetical protein BGP10_00085 [Rhodanobacter sp. 68-29]